MDIQLSCMDISEKSGMRILIALLQTCSHGFVPSLDNLNSIRREQRFNNGIEVSLFLVLVTH